MVSSQISTKITVLSFFAMFAVFVGHCRCDSRFEVIIRPWLIWHVPWFFIVSGYFFIDSLRKYSWKTFLRKKFFSILIPYLSWCCIGIILWIPDFAAKGITIMDILGITGSIFPAGNWPLWYVRALMIFMFTGLLIWSFRPLVPSVHVFFIFYCTSLIGMYYALSKIGVGVSPGSGLVSFLLGSAICYFRIPINFIISNRWRGFFIFVLVILAIVCRTLINSSVSSYLFIIIAIICLWLLLDFVNISKGNRWVAWMGLTPIIYFSHGPIVFAFNKYFELYLIPEDVSCVRDCYYILKCFSIFFILMVLMRYLENFSRIYKFLSGNR